MSTKGIGVSDTTDSLVAEIYALLDSIGTVYFVRDGEIIARARDGSIWTFHIPEKIRVATS